MSATPEQIAAELDEFAGEQEAKSAQEWLASMAAAYLNEAKQLRAAAALIRAQAERVRVLEGALEAIAALPRYTDGDNEAQDIARAALKAAP